MNRGLTGLQLFPACPFRGFMGTVREEAAMTEQPDHEIVDLELDETVPPRPEEEIADAGEELPAAG